MNNKTLRLIAILIISFMPGINSHAQRIQGTTSSEGGRGLLYMQTARTFGTGAFLTGFKTSFSEQEYTTYKKTTDHPTVLSIPVTLGLTDEIDLTAYLYGLHDSRAYIDRYDISKGFGSAFDGEGSAHVSVKIRLPISVDSKFQFAGSFGAVFPTSKKQTENINYRWSRTSTDIDASIFQTFDLPGNLSFHLTEGYTVSGSDIYDDQVFGGAGIELRIAKPATLSLEINNRTFLGVSPETLRKAGNDPKWYLNPTKVGDPLSLRDDEANFERDFFILTPAISLRFGDNFIFDMGVNYNIADQTSPKEKYQVVAGFTFLTKIKTMIDADNDGVRNRFDLEPHTPSGFPVNKYGISVDTDGDGIPDGKDKEANTPQGAIVDKDGVGMDSDKDGVYDGIDIEPYTLKGAQVDRFGVAIDEDRDGVPNIIDKEPSTAKGAIVNKNGVSMDSDKDGVPNGLDLEPNTPIGAIVDKDGVATDKDSDGVPDGLDMEPESPSENLVDKKGVSLVKPSIGFFNDDFMKLHTVYFKAYGESVLPEQYHLIDEIGQMMIAYPSLKIQIEGHTDKSGDPRKNLLTARKRAESVYGYLTKKFPKIDRNRIRVVGFGSDKPIATNNTNEGRELNRRVEFTIIK